MIDARRHDHQVALLEPDAHPVVALAPDIEVSRSGQDVPNLLILMQVLVEEILHLLLVARERRGRDLDLVTILVGAGFRQGVDAAQVGGVREALVEDPQRAEIGGVYWAARVVGETLVTLGGGGVVVSLLIL
jgi:hypothetical protein